MGNSISANINRILEVAGVRMRL